MSYMAIVMTILLPFIFGTVALVIGIKESDSSSVIIGLLCFAGGMLCWGLAAARFRGRTKRQWTIALLSVIFPWFWD